MNRPRFRVKTLLIATTIAAVVLACLAPWLRGWTADWWMAVGLRLGLIVLGALVSLATAVGRYHYFVRKARSESTAVNARCSRVRPKLMVGCLLLVMLVPTLLVLHVFFWRLEVIFGPSTSTSSVGWIEVVLHIEFLLQYMLLGFFAGFGLISWLTVNTPVWLTESEFVSRGLTTRWKPGMRFRWLDRAAGKMLLILPAIGHFELSIDEDKIEAAEALLTKYLPPWS